MSHRLVSPVAALLPFTACVVGLLSGCASLGLSFGDPQPHRPGAPLEKDESEPRSTVETQATLAAIETFLERTEEYQTGDAGLVTSPLSSPSSAQTATSQTEDVSTAAARPMLAVDRSPAGHDQAFANTHVALEDAPSARPVPALPVVQSVSIRPAPQTDAAPKESTKASATNEPLDMRSAQTPVPAEQLIAGLQARAAEARDFASEWRLRLTQLAYGRAAAVTEVSADLPHETRGVLSTLLHVVGAVHGLLRDPVRSGTEALDRVDELRAALASRAGVTVTTVSLCRKVVTFGVYEEMTDVDFVAGRTARTIVYSEIRNFQSEQTDDGRYRTKLATRLEVLTADGRSVWTRAEPQIVDLCRRRRTDFFIAERITLPPTLPAGEYVLKVLVEDGLSGQADEAVHPFVLNSALSVAQGR